MDGEGRGHGQPRKSQPVRNLLHEHARGSKSRRGNVGSAEVVDHAPDGGICRSHAGLTNKQRPGILAWVAHLRDNIEESRSPSVGKDERGNSRYSGGKRRLFKELEVGGPRAVRGRSCRPVLDPDRDGDN